MGGPNPSLEAQIPTSRPKSPPQGPNSSLKGFEPQDWDLGLEAEIWALRLGKGGGAEEKEEEKKKEKIPHMCESIGHRLLRGRCPKTSASSRDVEAIQAGLQVGGWDSY